MSPVPEIMLGVLALLILLGFFAGPSTKSNVHPDTKFGTGQAEDVLDLVTEWSNKKWREFVDAENRRRRI